MADIWCRGVTTSFPSGERDRVRRRRVEERGRRIARVDVDERESKTWADAFLNTRDLKKTR